MKAIILDNEKHIYEELVKKHENYSFKVVNTLECLIKEFSINEYALLIYNKQSEITCQELLSQLIKAIKFSPKICILSGRSKTHQVQDFICFGGMEELIDYISKLTVNLFEINYKKNELHYNGQVIKLTSIETEILKFFRNNPNTVLSKEEIEQSVWGEGTVKVRNTLATHLGNLKSKVPELNARLVNIRGKGYLLKV